MSRIQPKRTKKVENSLKRKSRCYTLAFFVVYFLGIWRRDKLYDVRVLQVVASMDNKPMSETQAKGKVEPEEEA